MTAIVVLLVVLGVGLPALWIWWTGWNTRETYRRRYDNLNRTVGGMLPPYDEVVEKGDRK